MKFEYKNTEIEIEFEYVKDNVWIPVKEAQGNVFSGISFVIMMIREHIDYYLRKGTIEFFIEFLLTPSMLQP